MFGFRFIKAQPNVYLLQYKGDRLVREGAGLAFYYFAPTTSLVAVPLGSVDVPFVLNAMTSDFQEVTVQGQAAYRVVDPKRLASMLNFTLHPNGRDYVSEDPRKLSQRLINVVQVLMRAEIENLALRQALRASDKLRDKVREGLSSSDVVSSLGLELLDLSVAGIRPNPEMARALEAEVREQLLKEADEATYARRNAAVEQERTIKENELNTEIAIEEKKHQMRDAEMAARISLEEKNKDLVALSAENVKREAEARAHATAAVMQAFAGVDSRVLQALASVGMDTSQLIAMAFRDLAEHANKIGQLNISSELLQELSRARMENELGSADGE